MSSIAPTGIIQAEVTTTVQFLPKCRQCGGVHPLARKPKMPDGSCPDCGASTTKEASFKVDGELLTKDPLAWLGLQLLKIGKWLGQMAQAKG